MEKCPFCGAETRPGDNFCLHCGNRLPQVTPSSASLQAPQGIGDTTVATPEDWGAAGANAAPPVNNWSDQNAAPPVGSWSDKTVTAGSANTDLPTVRADGPDGGIEESGRLILRSDNGEVVKEYPLDKPEIGIGRAPNSDILLSKDKLTSRRHATIRYENGNYVLRDERSANGTFVNGQQIEELVPRVLQDGDHVGIGEHELIFRSPTPPSDVERMPTVVVPFEAPQEVTYRTRGDETGAANDDFSTKPVDEAGLVGAQSVAASSNKADAGSPFVTSNSAPASASGNNGSTGSSTPSSAPSYSPTPITSAPAANVAPVASSAPQDVTPPTVVGMSGSGATAASKSYASSDAGVTFSRLTNIAEPTLPDLTNLMAALSSLDGQIMSLQEQFNTTQEAMKSHETEIANTTNQLRSGVRRVSERMDSTIADVARSREALAWADLLQLLEDVMNNPRDIDYVSRLARKASELNKVFQLHQNVLNTMAECNSLLRSMIVDEQR